MLIPFSHQPVPGRVIHREVTDTHPHPTRADGQKQQPDLARNSFCCTNQPQLRFAGEGVTRQGTEVPAPVLGGDGCRGPNHGFCSFSAAPGVSVLGSATDSLSDCGKLIPFRLYFGFLSCKTAINSFIYTCIHTHTFTT